MNKHLSRFVSLAVPFGLAMGALRYARDGFRGALVAAVFQGLFFGLAMTLIFAWREWATRKRLKDEGIVVEDLQPSQRRQVCVTASREEAFSACVAALESLPKVKVQGADATTGEITATSGMTWDSFGESIAVRLSPEPAGTSIEVTSTPRLRSTISDGGKGVRNVEFFLRALASLSTQPADA